MGKKKKKIRANFRKNRAGRTRRSDWTESYRKHGFSEEDTTSNERVSGKGDLTRRRTVVGVDANQSEQPGFGIHLDVDPAKCRPGRVLRVHGLISHVEDDQGKVFSCVTRRLLKTLTTDQRHVVAAGDRVLFRVVDGGSIDEGIIERVEPRHGSLCRTVRGRQHIIVTNVDRLFIITSAAEPRLKPNLIDRMLASAEKALIEPILCINKVDLIDPASLQPLVGVYSQMGYRVLLMSVETGFGLDRLTRLLTNRESVVAGQSGVGKSSILNALDDGLDLAVGAVSTDTQKGRHTTTTARLLPLAFGGYVVDTPGIRHFRLWDIIPEEVAGFYRDLRPLVHRCRFPDCTHTHEADCAVKDAVADGRLDARRYESYCHLLAGEME